MAIDILCLPVRWDRAGVRVGSQSVKLEHMKLETAERWVVLALLVTSLTACRSSGTRPVEPREPFVPTAPPRAVAADVRDFGARGSGRSDDSAAIERAIDWACSLAGARGARVYFPPGEYYSRPIQLRSHLTLELEAGATLRFSTDFSDYPLTLARWEGTECYNFRPPIYGRDLIDVAITGRGAIDGRGDAWYPMRRHARESSDRLRDMGERGVPVEERRFGTAEAGLRPSLIQFWDCRKVLVEGVEIRNSPMWTVHPVYSRELVFRDLLIRGDGPNTDGINPDSCEQVLIERCDIATDDDSIAIKSGRDRDGRRVNRPSRDIVIRDCRFARGHSGVAIGSETSGGVSNVRISDCTCDGTNAGILIKTQRGRGGVVEGVLAERITLKDVKRDGLMISMRYNLSQPEPNSERTPTVRDVTYRDIRGTSEQRAGRLIGLEEQDVTKVRLERVDLDARDGLACRWTGDVEMKDVSVRVQRGPALECADSHELRVDGLSASRSTGDTRGPFIEIIDVQGMSVRGVTAPKDMTGELVRATGPETRDLNLDVDGTESRVVHQTERDAPIIAVTTQPATTAASGPSTAPED